MKRVSVLLMILAWGAILAQVWAQPAPGTKEELDQERAPEGTAVWSMCVAKIDHTLAHDQERHVGFSQAEKSRTTPQMAKLNVPFIANQGQNGEEVSADWRAYERKIDRTLAYDEESRVGAPHAEKVGITSRMAKLHIPFIANQGQADESVKFYAKTFGGTVFITKDGEIFYSLPEIEEKKAVRGLALEEELVGGKVEEIKGEGEAITRVNYFRGKDQSKWKRDIPTYDLVSLGEVYEGIELKLKAYGNNVEKLFYVEPGAEPERIRVRLSGADALKVNGEGELEVESELGTVKFTKPVAYQEGEGNLSVCGHLSACNAQAG